MVMETGSPKARCQSLFFPSGSSLLGFRWAPLHRAPLHDRESLRHLCVSYKTTSEIALGSSVMTSFQLHHLIKI